MSNQLEKLEAAKTAYFGYPYFYFWLSFLTFIYTRFSQSTFCT